MDSNGCVFTFSVFLLLLLCGFELRERQKVKPYFLPVQSVKKVRQSLLFFGGKATQHQGRAKFSLFFSWFEGEATCLQTQTYLSKSSGCFLTLTYADGKRVKETPAMTGVGSGLADFCGLQRFAAARVTFRLIDDAEHGGAFAAKQTLAGFGKTTALDGRAAGAGDCHDGTPEKCFPCGKAEKPKA
jgi:hypothetical protein